MVGWWVLGWHGVMQVGERVGCDGGGGELLGWWHVKMECDGGWVGIRRVGYDGCGGH